MANESDTGAILIGIGIAVILIGGIALSFTVADDVFFNNKQAGEEIVDKSVDADKALNDYREFRALWYDIESAREQLENYEQQEKQFHETYGDDPKEWSRTAETRHGRIHDRITGQQNQISNLVAEYNAMSADATTSLYQCYLPYNVQDKMFIADGTGVKYKVDDPPASAPKAENINGEGCKFADPPTENESVEVVV